MTNTAGNIPILFLLGTVITDCDELTTIWYENIKFSKYIIIYLIKI